MTEVTFPPLMHGEAVPPGVDPFDKACAQARLGCDAGLVLYRLDADVLLAAMVFAPEVPLKDAVTMLPLCAVGFQNALGALAPPEVAVHLEWAGGLRVNGARCGGLRMAASDTDPEAEPHWLVVGLTVPLWPKDVDTGHTPDQTALYAEGCAEVDAARLLESWTRHTLSQINRWSEEGAGPLHQEWRGLAQDMGEDVFVFGQSGTFLGVDERFGMLLRSETGTDLIPLIRVLEADT
jgi:biotin-(acetyl-CoA carboxylase) ligase